jgi:hypothetical protein
MIIAALPASQPRFPSPPPAPEQEADVLTNAPVLLRPQRLRQAPPIAATERALPLRSRRQDCRHPP